MDKKIKEYIELIKSKSKEIGIEKIVIIILCIIFLIVSSVPLKKSTTKNSTNEAEHVESTTSDYANTLEKKLETALSKVEGVGTVKVIVTLKSTKESVVNKDSSYSKNEVNEEDGEGGNRKTNNYEQSQETVFKQEGNSSVPFVVKEIEPEIEGVLVVAAGGGNATVVANITEGVLALVNVPTHKITVLKMSQSK